MKNTIKHIGLLTSGGDAGIVAEGHQNGGIAELASITARRFPDVDIRVFILGHIQRDGSPSCADRVLAGRLGVDAIEQLHSGESVTMVAFQHQTMCGLTLHEVIKQQPVLQIEQLRLSHSLAR